MKRSKNFYLKKTDSEDTNIYLPNGTLLDQNLVPIPNDITTENKIYPYSRILRTKTFSRATEDQFITLTNENPEPMNIQLVTPTYSIGNIE